ncbi:hypothetical protein SAMN05192534_1188 [Alteribacillus persepolensis]|uniref:Uncharacterized protein n=1 Tax=Alteribacillus persepolensis TaxID=568899 RepID=A0A1G8H1G6_9BACI|nr:hypothetical protein [Alteribacillus persepolensis]SDI00446.1 hypothetical protein SAMN05192534_1188 [Alteribacillus persepolensis]
MFARIFMMMVGFGLAAAGGISLIAYMNYIPAGLTMVEYLQFIVKSTEAMVFAAGLLLIVGSIYWPEKK